jgi:plastocyanin
MSDGTKSTTTHVVYIVIIVILLIVIAGGLLYFNNKQQQSAMMANARPAMNGQMTPPKNGQGRGMNMGIMAPVTPPPVSDQQQQQLTAGADKSSTNKTFNITGGNYYFVPSKITVNQGDKVTFVMTNGGGFHDLVIDELGVKTAMTKSGETATATFTASKRGSFVYYCSIKGHRQKGMSGTLTVQ